MDNFKDAVKLVNEFTFADVKEVVESRPNVVLVKLTNDKVYGISRRRIDKSSCEPTTKLRVDSHEGKFLIPEDSIESTTPNW